MFKKFLEAYCSGFTQALHDSAGVEALWSPSKLNLNADTFPRSNSKANDRRSKSTLIYINASI